ncbi:Ig-like domain-containing protein [Pontibacter pamirensis]|uniref:Ig-like domain-containing protein n=1 Tax=Pontibacter pamirensis TaxID=2562824 RepID=UPI00138A029B|nr:Ig-like domain-containing protein [Pontibacter pamirensis]
MEKLNWLYLFLFAFTIAACDDGAEPSLVVPEPDTVHPVVSIKSPADNDTLLVYEQNEIKVNITDNKGLSDVRVYVDVLVCDDMYFDFNCIPTPQEMPDEAVSISKGNSSLNWNLTIHIPSVMFIGTYTYIVEAVDRQQNVTKSSFTFTVLAPDLDLASFSTIFSQGAFENIDNGDGFLNYDELGAAFHANVFHGGEDMETGADDEDYWNWFVQLHGLENQIWSDWDTNGDDIMQPKEFSSGLEKAGFLAEWDLNKDHLFSQEEFANYLFHRLDLDGDGMLSSNEYLYGFTSNHWL